MEKADIHIIIPEKENQALLKLSEKMHNLSITKLVCVAINFYLKARKII